MGTHAWVSISGAVAILLWGSVYSFIRVALQGFSAVELTFVRLAGGVAVLSAYAATGHSAMGQVRWRSLTRQEWAEVGLLGLVGFVIYWTLLNLGEQTVSATTSSFIVNTTPAITTVLAVIFLKERLAPRALLGVVLSFLGVTLLWLEEEHAGAAKASSGALTLCGAALAHAIHFVLQRKLLGRLTPLEVTLGSMGVGALVMAPLVPDLVLTIARASAGAIAAAVYLAVLPSALAHLAWSFVLKHTPASAATSLLILISPTALLFGVIWLREQLSPLAWCGGALAVAGVVLVMASAIHAQPKPR